MYQSLAKYPTGLEGEELAMMDSNRHTEQIRKTNKRNLILNITVGIAAAAFISLAISMSFIGFAFPFFMWLGWNTEKFLNRK